MNLAVFRRRTSLAKAVKMVMIIIIFVTALFGGAPTGNHELSAAGPVAAFAVPADQSVGICVVQDQTRSTQGTGIPQLEPSALTILIELAKQQGGEIGLAIVREASNLPLTRLHIPVPPAKPSDARQTMNIIDRARRGQAAGREYQTRERVWNEHVDREVPAFLTRASARLSGSPDAPATDLWSAIARCDQFLAESTQAVRGRRYMVTVTDGIDTAGRNPRQLQSGASVLLVPGTSIGSLAALQPAMFESPLAAFRFIASNVRRAP